MPDKNKALLSLRGLSIGDAFGAKLGEGNTSRKAIDMMQQRILPTAPWSWTDDTHMALSIVEVLKEEGSIAQDKLAQLFAQRFKEDPNRGYGPGAARLLREFGKGGDWKELSPRLFGEGSYGNGAAMRVVPVGGYFFGQPEKAAEEAKKSAIITHAHPEGIAGAVAVAVAASIVGLPEYDDKKAFLNKIASYLKEGETKKRIIRAGSIPRDQLLEAMEDLGTGWLISAQDTVPFCLWVVAHYRNDFEEALWITASGEGDRDTTCAIVGGIVALSAGEVPEEWITRCEDLPESAK